MVKLFSSGDEKKRTSFSEEINEASVRVKKLTKNVTGTAEEATNTLEKIIDTTEGITNTLKEANDTLKKMNATAEETINNLNQTLENCTNPATIIEAIQYDEAAAAERQREYLERKAFIKQVTEEMDQRRADDADRADEIDELREAHEDITRQADEMLQQVERGEMNWENRNSTTTLDLLPSTIEEIFSDEEDFDSSETNSATIAPQ